MRPDYVWIKRKSVLRPNDSAISCGATERSDRHFSAVLGKTDIALVIYCKPFVDDSRTLSSVFLPTLLDINDLSCFPSTVIL